MDALLNDLRYALRLWVRNPGFTLVAVITLALGIGANTLMFSIVNAALFQPLPFPEPDRIVTVWGGRVDRPESLNIVSLPVYRDWQARSRVFESLAIFDSAGRGYNLTGDGEPQQVSGLRVTASFFDVLGIAPLYGRTFRPEEEEPGRDDVVVLSHGLWTRRFAADPALVGKTIRIDGRPFTVVGVMPPHFRFQFWSGPRELFVPAGWTEGDRERSSNSFIAIGRLRDGVGIDEARAEMDAIGRALALEHPEAGTNRTARVVPIEEYSSRGLRVALLTTLAVVGLVLLIACVNVANLMLARAAARQRELAVRAAIGASRSRLLRQLLTESVALALVGGVSGLVLAIWGTALLPAVLPEDLLTVPLRPIDAIGIDWTVLGFTTAVACLSGVLFGIAPAFASWRGDASRPLVEGARGAVAGGRSRLRYALVSCEMALALVVLAGAGVMIVSVARLLGVDPGLDPRNVLVASISLPQENLYYGPPDHPRFCDELAREVGAVPGILSASAIGHLPLSGGGAGRGFTIEGRPDPGPDRSPNAGYSVACPGILETLGIKLVAGREFTFADRVGAPGVVLVNETMARTYWPGEDAIGKRFKLGPPASDEPWLTIVGIFRDVRHWGLDREPRPSFLRPYSQAAWPVMSIVVRTAGAPASFERPVKKALATIEPGQPISGVTTMEQVVAGSVASRRFPMMLLSGFAVLALVLAAVGIAGVVGYSVVQRTPEIGVRMAFGAEPRDVRKLVIGHSLKWALLGVGLGLAGAAGLLRLLRGLVFGLEPTDPVVLGCVSLLLLAVAVAASYLPARRASRVDPVTALREG